MTPAMTPTLKAAQEAIAGGRTDEAYRLLKKCAREDPADYRPWLWLAGLAKSKQQSMAYLDRAEQLQPGEPTIQKARAWAQQRFVGEPAGRPATAVPAAAPVAASAVRSVAPPRPVAPPRSSAPVRSQGAAAASPAGEAGPERPSKRSWIAVGALLLILALFLGSAALLLSNRIFPGTVFAADPSATPEPAGIIVVADVPEEAATEPTDDTDASLLSSPTPAPTRAQPTPTLQPTNTPAPTPTVAPTVVVSTGGENILETVTVAEGERWIDVNLTTQQLTAYEGGNIIYTTLVSSGLSTHPTVTGQFRIWLRYESQTMNGYLLGYDYYLEDVPYVMYFYNDYALHGAYWHNNFGTPMSHGCVNLSISDAEWVFNFTSLGTLVNVHY